MKLRYFVLLAVALLGLAVFGHDSAVLAQTDNQTPAFKNVTLALNPEYDDPRLLVMMEGELDGVSPPARVSFLVPSSAVMYSAGSLSARNGQGYSGGPPDRKPASIEGWDEISYTLKTNIFRMEYYDAIIPDQPDKAISYDFRTISPISDLRVIIQEPKKASNFTVTPKGTSGKDGEGFNIVSSFYTNVTAATALHFDISYTRTETKPSISQNPSASTTTGSSKTSLIILGIIGVILAGIVVLWLVKSQQREAPVSGKRRERRQAARQKQGTGKRFCSKCGQLLEGSDKFCPSCGAKVGG